MFDAFGQAREPRPLTLHHLPIAVTFAFLSDESIVVGDPAASLSCNLCFWSIQVIGFIVFLKGMVKSMH